MASGAPAQQFLDIETIREDVAVLKDGGLRVILMCSSINFALKSADEQDAVIYQYQNFLNALDFTVQLVIHSRKLNILPYIELLKERQKEEDNDLLKIQITEYIEFIRTFVEMTNIMSKTFYIVVPFNPTAFEQKSGIGRYISFLGFRKKKTPGNMDSFEEQKNQLWQRVDTVVSGLQRVGIRSTPLNTEELIELFYGLYNPTEFEQTVRGDNEATQGLPLSQ